MFYLVNKMYSLVLDRIRGASIKHNLDLSLISLITCMFLGERMAHVIPPGFQEKYSMSSIRHQRAHTSMLSVVVDSTEISIYYPFSKHCFDMFLHIFQMRYQMKDCGHFLSTDTP